MDVSASALVSSGGTSPSSGGILRTAVKRSYMKRVGSRGARRRAEWIAARDAHFEEHPTCQALEYGLDTPCSGVRDCHHITNRGMGSGKDYGKYVTLCRTHHQWVSDHPVEAKEIGLLVSFWKAEQDG